MGGNSFHCSSRSACPRVCCQASDVDMPIWRTLPFTSLFETPSHRPSVFPWRRLWCSGGRSLHPASPEISSRRSMPTTSVTTMASSLSIWSRSSRGMCLGARAVGKPTCHRSLDPLTNCTAPNERASFDRHESGAHEDTKVTSCSGLLISHGCSRVAV